MLHRLCSIFRLNEKGDHLQGLYMAPVAKSGISQMAPHRMSAISGTGLTFLWVSPGAGFVLWQVVTFPPKTVAQELKRMEHVTSKNANLEIFFILFLIYVKCLILLLIIIMYTNKIISHFQKYLVKINLPNLL